MALNIKDVAQGTLKGKSGARGRLRCSDSVFAANIDAKAFSEGHLASSLELSASRQATAISAPLSPMRYVIRLKQ